MYKTALLKKLKEYGLLKYRKLSELQRLGSSLFHEEIVEGKKEFLKNHFLRWKWECWFDPWRFLQKINGKEIEDAVPKSGSIGLLHKLQNVLPRVTLVTNPVGIYLLKVNNRNSIDVVLVSLFLTLNIFHAFVPVLLLLTLSR